MGSKLNMWTFLGYFPSLGKYSASPSKGWGAKHLITNGVGGHFVSQTSADH